MKCPKCHTDNPDSSRFCGSCAAAITQEGQPPAVTITVDSLAFVLTKGSLVAGKYRITEEIGRGGMGVVYKAEDTKLGRNVAIKVLPEVFTRNAERLARFEREAKILASLNHPHIATLFGLEETDGKRFLVMELVDGETLGERIDRGPLSLEEALKICVQVAEGVEAAHEKGIVHRDLKPANVKLTPDGKVKVLDFGLAKARPADTSGVDLERSPTITGQMTEPGVILGTAAYMSPEQATGRPVDKRADIWAFGCILFECLTGMRAFQGATVTETIAAILRGEPDWGSLPAGIPVNVQAVLRRCLQKDPRLRLHDVADARIEIEAPIIYSSQAVPTTRRLSLPLLGVCAAAILFAGILIDRVITKKFRFAPSPSMVTSTIKIEPGHWLDGMRSEMQMEQPSRTAMAISSDGKFIVYSAVDENLGPQAKPQLYLRRLDQSGAKPITGTVGGINPFLSPDNRWVGFWTDGKLKKVPIEGGVPHDLCDASPRLYGANWDFDNRIVFTSKSPGGLSIVSADGGKPETLTTPDPKREESSHRLPSWLPNGKAVLFTVTRHGWDRQSWLALLRLDTGEWKVLLQDAADARYVPTGHLVYLRQGTLMAVRFDLAKLEVIAQPSPLVGDVMQSFSSGAIYNTCAGQFSISDTGSLIYAAGGIVPDLNNSLVWVDQKGIEQPVTALPFPFFAPRLSPDGQRIAYSTLGRDFRVWVYDLDRGTNSSLNREGGATQPIWSHDGKRLLFAWHKSLARNLYWQPHDGSLPMERLTTSDFPQWAGSSSSDGKTLALVENRPETYLDIAMLDIRSGSVTPFLNSQFNEIYPDFSPDGRWLAYTSDESGREEVYVKPFPGPGMKRQVSSEGGSEPLWARYGRQLFYRWQDQVWVVDVRTDGGFAATKPRLLFKKSGYAGGAGAVRGYDLSPDGQRFLMVKLGQRKPAPVTEMILVQNWFEELKRLVPIGKK